jgi:hypothetical protein
MFKEIHMTSVSETANHSLIPAFVNIIVIALMIKFLTATAMMGMKVNNTADDKDVIAVIVMVKIIIVIETVVVLVTAIAVNVINVIAVNVMAKTTIVVETVAA